MALHVLMGLGKTGVMGLVYHLAPAQNSLDLCVDEKQQRESGSTIRMQWGNKAQWEMMGNGPCGCMAAAFNPT